MSICVAFYCLNELTDIHYMDGKVIPYFPIDKIKYKWEHKNIFGKIQTIVFIIIFFPTIISMSILCLLFVYGVRFFIWFVELGNKK